MTSESGTSPTDGEQTPGEHPADATTVVDADGRAEDDSTKATPWWRRHLTRYPFAPMAVAVVFVWLAMTPSLLPRGAFFQGVVSGASAAVGYCLGVFVSWFIRFMMSRDEPWRPASRRLWTVLGIVALVGTVLMLLWFANWQTEIRSIMDVDGLPWTSYPLIAITAVIVFLLLVTFGRLFAFAVRWSVRHLNRIAPPRVSAAVGAIVVVALTIFILNGVVAKYSMQWLNASFAAANEETKAETSPPTSSLRSGGPGSLVTWDSLGREGRVFVSKGPDVGALSLFNGSPAQEPIRVYAGLESADSLREEAELATEELVRTGGLEREVVAVASTTGSGWVNKATVDSLEYMYNGDIATVSMQYSYLPSWLSFLVDKERARQAGRALFEAVSERVRAIPEAERPKLIVFGESLGSFAGEAAFGTIPALAARTDGALFSGPTFNNTLWNDTVSNRDPGSPQVLPVYDDGTHVRFIADETDLSRPDAPWEQSRLVYLQHSSDPITWWSPRLILNEPDWLDEPRGRDVLSSTRWIPFVTFLQVSADMAVAVNVPDGHGHDYKSSIPYAWAQILQPPGWTDAKTVALLPRLHRD
ncbi:alpha/beta-hydrolase family protein [Gordonia sp. PKS22-38]|uniref:Alpha/beta-hydrolase family protein n=1 Tax=Gordonia prachuapensis TaxID=3115651 RepID=A0ABU7MW69_9ACTN|nr:alpha/beta-hydrolase family protein [Gordonia sp. PKS22-38]